MAAAASVPSIDPKRTQRENWCFTLNNYTDEDIEQIKSYITSMCIRGVFGKEVGDSGTPHLQGYFELQKKTTVNGIKRGVKSDTIHLESRKGSAYQAWAYCLKQDPAAFVFGNPPRMAYSCDQQIERMKSSKVSYRELLETSPTYAIRHLTLYHQVMQPVRHTFFGIHWITGAPGVGKSLLASKYHGGYTPLHFSHWWDCYDREHIVKFDDFRYSDVPLNQLLKIADRYEYRVPTKGGSVQCNCQILVITTTYTPQQVFAQYGSSEPPQQLYRRISLYTNFETGNTYYNPFSEGGLSDFLDGHVDKAQTLLGTTYILADATPLNISGQYAHAPLPEEDSRDAPPSSLSRQESIGRDSDRFSD